MLMPALHQLCELLRRWLRTLEEGPCPVCCGTGWKPLDPRKGWTSPTWAPAKPCDCPAGVAHQAAENKGRHAYRLTLAPSPRVFKGASTRLIQSTPAGDPPKKDGPS